MRLRPLVQLGDVNGVRRHCAIAHDDEGNVTTRIGVVAIALHSEARSQSLLPGRQVFGITGTPFQKRVFDVHSRVRGTAMPGWN